MASVLAGDPAHTPPLVPVRGEQSTEAALRPAFRPTPLATDSP